MKRPSRDLTNLRVARIIGERGTCLRAKVGAVATIDNRIVSTGYNGSAKGMPHCTADSCSSEEHCPNSVHAEANLIAYAAKKGVALEGATLYCTHSPCRKCSELIIQAGFSTIIYNKTYRDTDWALLERANITCIHIDSYED